MQFDSYRIENPRAKVKKGTTNNCNKPPDHPDYWLHDERGWRSAFEIIIQRESKAFANEEIFKHLIHKKWAETQWIYIFYVVLPYVSVMVVFIAATLLRVKEFEEIIDSKPGIDLASQLVVGKDTLLKNTSGQMMVVVASAGSAELLHISWVLLRVGLRHLGACLCTYVCL
jgi:hypothetical protein